MRLSRIQKITSMHAPVFMVNTSFQSIIKILLKGNSPVSHCNDQNINLNIQVGKYTDISSMEYYDDDESQGTF